MLETVDDDVVCRCCGWDSLAAHINAPGLDGLMSLPDKDCFGDPVDLVTLYGRLEDEYEFALVSNE